MSARPVATVAMNGTPIATRKAVAEQFSSDRSERSDPKAQCLSKNQTLSVLVQWMRDEVEATPAPPTAVDPADLFPVTSASQLDALADAAEQEAMRAHYAARAGPVLAPDPMKAGLLRGFYAHRNIAKKD